MDLAPGIPRSNVHDQLLARQLREKSFDPRKGEGPLPATAEHCLPIGVAGDSNRELEVGIEAPPAGIRRIANLRILPILAGAWNLDFGNPHPRPDWGRGCLLGSLATLIGYVVTRENSDETGDVDTYHRQAKCLVVPHDSLTEASLLGPKRIK
ncbi:hypothetical protein CRG98_039282 [Punica granatum]|uniref:Uncharacterized protein n=1 Tax=Punica granatum TaxID=22663 RepID=A0A2I0I8K7_PUNGR|nr:hypothetical protein CRG98_039282 [Punica granatum]